MRKRYVAALCAELDRAGITGYRVEPGGKHPRVVFEHAGRRRMYVFSGSGSDSARGVRNAVSDLRRILGLAAPSRSKSKRPSKLRAVRPDVEPRSFAVRPNPLLILASWRGPECDGDRAIPGNSGSAPVEDRGSDDR